jgi:GNAT superfamily N-acetyltransferase
MEFAVLGWPPDGPTLRLDYREFAYAGKFVMSNTGKAVARESARDVEFDHDAKSDHDAESDDNAGFDTDAESDSDVDAVADYDADVVAAIAFNADRTAEATLWYRYVTVRSSAKGEAIAPRLAAFVAPQAASRGYERLRIAVNNPFAYEAMYKAGFEWTGEETGFAELVLERPVDGTPETLQGEADVETYRAGLDRFRERDLDDSEATFLLDRVDADLPEPCDVPARVR